MDGMQELAVRVKLCHLYGQLLLRSAAGDALTASQDWCPGLCDTQLGGPPLRSHTEI